jgi:hypothetical protein
MSKRKLVLIKDNITGDKCFMTIKIVKVVSFLAIRVTKKKTTCSMGIELRWYLGVSISKAEIPKNT